ncbi:MAG: DUF998 domain-containing protein, partial [Patescibacteria group bacterium]
VIEALTRSGFDPTRHDLSLLANGSWGWVHSTLLVTTGLLAFAAAVGMRRVLRGNKGGKWGPLLLGLYGLGLVGAGFFAADPALGFPPGTPADARDVSAQGLMHLVSGSIGFLGLIAACFVFARRFASSGERRWALYSKLTGIFYFAAFFGIAMGSNGSGALLTTVIFGFIIAVILGWAWISAVSARLKRELT